VTIERVPRRLPRRDQSRAIVASGSVENRQGDVVPHRRSGGDPSHEALELYTGEFGRDAVVCPIPAGGCTMHASYTPHMPINCGTRALDESEPSPYKPVTRSCSRKIRTSDDQARRGDVEHRRGIAALLSRLSPDCGRDRQRRSQARGSPTRGTSDRRAARCEQSHRAPRARRPCGRRDHQVVPPVAARSSLHWVRSASLRTHSSASVSSVRLAGSRSAHVFFVRNYACND